MTRQAVDTAQRGTLFVVGTTVKPRLIWGGVYNRTKRITELLEVWDKYLASLEKEGNRYNDCVRERLRKLLYKVAFTLHPIRVTNSSVPFANCRLRRVRPHLPRLTRLREIAALFSPSTPPGIYHISQIY